MAARYIFSERRFTCLGTLNILVLVQFRFTNEPPRGKTNNVVSEQFDTNRAVQAQKRGRTLKFRI